MKTHKMPSMGKFQSVENYDGKPNQFLIKFEKGEILQSYKSIIVVRHYPTPSRAHIATFIGQDWAYSKTTAKYRCAFLGELGKETQAKIDSGEYKILNI